MNAAVSSRRKTKQLLEAGKPVAEFLLARENGTWDVVTEAIDPKMRPKSDRGLEDWWLRAHGKEKQYADVVLVALYFAYPDKE